MGFCVNGFQVDDKPDRIVRKVGVYPLVVDTSRLRFPGFNEYEISSQPDTPPAEEQHSVPR